MRIRWNYSLFSLVSGFVIANTSVFHSRYAIKETHAVPDGWNCIGKAPLDHQIELHIALKQANFNILERKLYEGKPRIV